MKHAVSSLEGAMLDAAVAQIEGIELLNPPIDAQDYPAAWDEDCWRGWSACRDWRVGGPIIDRERIELGFLGDGHGWQSAVNPEASADWAIPWIDGPTPLIAAMRAYVASKFGDEVELP